jgi:hypothetical protein
MAGGHDPLGDRGHLLSALPRSEHHFRKTLSNGPVVIYAREPEVLERRMAQNLKEALMRSLRRKGTGVHLVEQRTNLMTVHHAKPLPCVDLPDSRAVISPIGFIGRMITL